MEIPPHTADGGGVGLSAIAFEEIYGQHMPELTRYCRGILRNRADAEDAAQNAMERALKALTEGPPPQRMRPWLLTIAQRESVNLLRRRSRMGSCELDASAPAPGGSPEELARIRERLADLLADLQALAPRQRQALVARELDGRGYTDIATELGVTEAAAQQLVLEARQSLRQCEAGRSLECREVQAWISAHDHGVIRTRRVRAHLRGCDGCHTFQRAIAARRRDFGLLLPGVSGGALWSALTATLGHGGAKLATAGAVALTGVTISLPALTGGSPMPEFPTLRAGHPAAATTSADAAVSGARTERGSRPARARRAAAPSASRRSTAQRRKMRLDERATTGLSPTGSSAAPTLAASTSEADAARATRPRRTPEPAPASTPAGSGRSEPVSQPVRDALTPVTQAVDAVRTAVPQATGALEQVEDALPPVPSLGGG